MSSKTVGASALTVFLFARIRSGRYKEELSRGGAVYKNRDQRKDDGVKTAILFLVGLLIFMAMTGCETEQGRMLGTMNTPRQGMISKEELRDLLNIYRDYYVEEIKQLADRLDQENSSSRVRQMNLQMRMRIISAVDAMLEPTDPVVSFLEVWGLTIRMRMYLEEGEAAVLYKPQYPVVLEFTRKVEAEIERIGQLFLDAEKFQSARENLIRFARKNPIRGTHSNFVVMATQERVEGTNPLLSVVTIPMAPFSAMRGVDRTADAVYQFRNTAERFTDVVKELPEMAQWEAMLLMYELDEAPMTQSFLGSLERVADSSTRLAETAEKLPVMLEQMDSSQAAFQETLTLARQASVEIRAAAESFEQTGKTLRETAVVWDKAAQSTTELVTLFKTAKPRGPQDPPPFTMRDFDALVENIGSTAEQIRQTALSIQQAMESSPQGPINASVDHITKRILQLMLAGFILLAAYHFLTRKRSQHSGQSAGEKKGAI
jgi:hypothetical protein